MTERENLHEEGKAPPDKKLQSLPPRVAARIRRQLARQRVQEREQAEEPLLPPEEASPPHPDDQLEAAREKVLEETQEETRGEPRDERPALISLDEDDAWVAPSETEPEDAPALSAAPPPPVAPTPREPSTPPQLGQLAMRPRSVPTVSGVFKELGKGAWESVASIIESNVRRLKRRRTLGETESPVFSDSDLEERRPKVRGYFLLSTAIHVLLFLPLINIAMLQEPEKKPPVYVRILDTPPPAEKISKEATESKTPKTEKRETKVVEAKGPKPEPAPVTRETVEKKYVTPKKMLVAKATTVDPKAAEAPKVPKPLPAQMEAPRPRTSAELPKETEAQITVPTKPLVLPENLPKVASLAETLPRRESPEATRPTELAVSVATVPDIEGRNSRLVDSVPKEFRESDRLAAPTEAPPLPPTQAPTPRVLGQAAPVASGSAPEAPNVLSQTSSVSTAGTRPVDERRTAQSVEARLGGEVGPISPTQPVIFSDTNELGPVGAAPTEFQEEITVPLNSDDPRFKEYLEAVKRRILEVWRYPDDAEAGLRGKVSVEFSIERDGSVSRVYVRSTSGFVALDRGATEAMRRASPFLPLPPDFNTNRLNIVGGFIYN